MFPSLTYKTWSREVSWTSRLFTTLHSHLRDHQTSY